MTNRSPAPAHPPVQPYAWAILVVVYLASIVAPLNQFKIPPIMPLLMPAFHLDLTQAGLLMSLIAMVGLVLALPGGVILGRLGPKVTLLISLALMAAGAALGALAASFGLLLASRLLEGLGIGLMGVVAPAAIAMWFPPERQGMPMGIWATWVPFGSVLIYNLAPGLTNAFGWQASWWLGCAAALVMIVVCTLLFKTPPQPAGGLEQRAPAHEAGDLRQALANRDIWLLALSFACMNFTMVSLATFYPTYLNEVRGYALGQAGFLASLGSLVVLFSAPAAGWLSDRIGSRRLVLCLPFLALGATVILPFVVEKTLIPASLLLQGLLVGAIPSATFAAAPEVMRRPQWAGLGLAVVLIGQNLGQLVGPLIFSQAVGGLGWTAAAALLIPLCLLGFASGWLVRIR